VNHESTPEVGNNWRLYSPLLNTRFPKSAFLRSRKKRRLAAIKVSKNFFFEPCRASRFRLRGQEAASSSGRKKQKTFISFRPMAVEPARSKITKVFFASFFVHKKEDSSSFL
jgi:hypothetical protein